MSTPAPEYPEVYREFDRAVPAWFPDAKLGIFVHWGPYSVPAWAEPIGALGTIVSDHWYAHNPYAEWYHNTIRIAGSPAQRHQAEVYGSAPYDAFLDAWKAEEFDADAFMTTVADSGARYVIPTTKHHDGVALWDAPGTGDRNTVKRGPRRDLVGEFRDAARRAGLRFGAYYSGGLDWHATGQPAITSDADHERRPVDAEYAEYAFAHVADLIERYQPDILWNDIEWPDAGKPDGPTSQAELFRRFYELSPEGLVNDRWGQTHWDYRTSEYEYGRDIESGIWEHCRGIGYSFGYNRLEDASVSLGPLDAVRYFVDIVSRGGNLLLNVGPTASGEIPAVQRKTLAGLGAWNRVHGDAIFGSRPLDESIARPTDAPWVRWTRTDQVAHAFVDAPRGVSVSIDLDTSAVDLTGAKASPGASLTLSDDRAVVAIMADAAPGPVRIDLPLRPPRTSTASSPA